jgi:tetratricopeptide (TPR) repeat protein
VFNRTYTALIAFVWAIILAAPVAQAQSDLDEKARTHFQAGSSFYDEGNYEQALSEFQSAYQLSKRPELQYNISLTYEKLGDLNNAIIALERYLNEGKEISNRTTLEVRRENLRKRLDRQQQGEPETTPEGGAQPAEGEGAGQALDMPQAETGAIATGSAARATTKPSGKLKLTTPVLVSYIAAGAGALTYAIFGTMAVVEDGSLKDKCLAPEPSCSEDEVSNLRTYSLVADIGLAVALVGGVVGTVLLLTAGHKEEKKVETTVAVAPWVTPTGLGAVSQVRF